VIPVPVNPIATRATALAWIGGWKILDIISTWLAFSWADAPGRELNLLINAAAPYIGFNTALLLTVPVALGMVYAVHHRVPALNEVLALSLPLIVVSNFMILAGPTPWLVAAGGSAVVLAGYVLYAVVCDVRTAWRMRSLRPLLTLKTEPVLWTPHDVAWLEQRYR